MTKMTTEYLTIEDIQNMNSKERKRRVEEAKKKIPKKNQELIRKFSRRLVSLAEKIRRKHRRKF